MLESIGHGLEQLVGATSGCSCGAAVKTDAVGEQQLKQMQSGSSSQSRRNRGAVDAYASEEQQLKQT